MQPTATVAAHFMVCVSVCVLGTLVSSAEQLNWSRGRILAGPGNTVLQIRLNDLCAAGIWLYVKLLWPHTHTHLLWPLVFISFSMLLYVFVCVMKMDGDRKVNTVMASFCWTVAVCSNTDSFTGLQFVHGVLLLRVHTQFAFNVCRENRLSLNCGRIPA